MAPTAALAAPPRPSVAAAGAAIAAARAAPCRAPSPPVGGILAAKSAIMTQKFFSLKNINMGIKKTQFYADFKFVDADLNKCP